MTDERRERYAAAIYDAHFGQTPGEDVGTLADAAMAVADKEVRTEWERAEKAVRRAVSEYDRRMGAEAENARLRAALDRLNVAYDKLEEAFYEQ